MPFSSEKGKDSIRKMIGRVPHATILDIGCGCGTYAAMFDDAEITGVEIWEPYVRQYNLESLYDRLVIADAREWAPNEGVHYDVAIAGDVLEHMTVDEARSLLDKLRQWADTVVVSIPLGHHPQGEWEGNPHERHVVDNWSHEEAIRVFGKPDWHKIDDFIGVYIWSKHRLRPKICVYAISKNEEQFVERFCEAAKDADLISISDTGSTDGTVEKARQCGAVVSHICITPWRFDHARNTALALVPRDVDICVSLDLDEVMQPGWREEIERVWELGTTTRLRYMFDWGAGIAFKYEKIHARHGYHWHHPCHEYPVPDGRVPEVWADTDMLLVVHKPDPTKSRGQYLDLLELSVKEDPHCPRNAFYYARELSFHAKWREAIVACERYLKLPRADWPNERCYAYRVMGRCYNELGEVWNAERMFQMAAYEAPNTREPWCELAMLMYRQGRWEECFAAAMRALRITDRLMVYTVDPEVWGHQPHDLASIAAWHLGLKEISLKQAELAVSMSPNDERLRANFRYIQNSLKEADGIPNVVHMMFFTNEKSRDFSFVNYLSVRSVHDVQKPDIINFYYNEEPQGNPNWEAMKSMVNLIKINPSKQYEEYPLFGFPQYWSDVARIHLLYEHGGMYFDTDCILLKPMTEFLQNDLVLCGDMSKAGNWTSGATLLAKKNSPFIKKWLEELRECMNSNVWALHITSLPARIYMEGNFNVKMLPPEYFLPFDWTDKSILEKENAEETLKRLSSSYVIHLWDSMWMEDLKKIDYKYVIDDKTPLARLLLRFVEERREAA